MGGKRENIETICWPSILRGTSSIEGRLDSLFTGIFSVNGIGYDPAQSALRWFISIPGEGFN